MWFKIKTFFKLVLIHLAIQSMPQRQIEKPSFVNPDGTPMTKKDYLKLDLYKF